MTVATYGVRSIGSPHYLGYASTHVEFIDEGPRWALVAFTIFASTLLHSLTASGAVRVLDREDGENAAVTPAILTEPEIAIPQRE